MGRRWQCGVLRPVRASFVALAAGLFGCGGGNSAPAPREPGPVRVVASIPPMAGLAAPLLSEGATVRTVISPGQSPHTYEPGPGDLASLAEADLVVVVGLGIEWSLPARATASERTISMAAALGVEEATDDEHDHAGHDHEGHAHGPIDAHLWLDPALVERFVPMLAERVRQAQREAGEAESDIGGTTAREADLLERVREVDRAYRERLAPFAGAAVITQHAAWSRLAERYGLEIAGVIQEVESVEPSPAHLAELVALARERGVRAIVTEPQLDRAVAARLAAQLGLPLATLDPLGMGDWKSMMMANLDSLESALAGEGSGG